MTMTSSQAKEIIATGVEELIKQRLEGLCDELDAQSIEVTRSTRSELRLRVLPCGKSIPRYFTIKISENH